MLSCGPCLFLSLRPSFQSQENQKSALNQSHTGGGEGGGVQTESCFIKSAISSDICEDKNKICDPKKMF